MMTEIINLTPHTVTVIGDDVTNHFPPVGDVARVSSESVQVDSVDGIPIYNTTFGEVENLPAPANNTIYIVSALVRQATPERDDLVSPSGLIRNNEGVIIGCRGFDRN